MNESIYSIIARIALDTTSILRKGELIKGSPLKQYQSDVAIDMRSLDDLISQAKEKGQLCRFTYFVRESGTHLLPSYNNEAAAQIEYLLAHHTVLRRYECTVNPNGTGTCIEVQPDGQAIAA